MATKKTVKKDEGILSSKTEDVDEVTPEEEDTIIEKEKEMIEDDKLKQQNDLLLKQIEEMKSKMADLQVKADVKIFDQYADITVVSLRSGVLNLATGPNGTQQIYTFSGFGKTNEISYGELKKVLQFYRNRFENGDVYIDNPDVVKALGLTIPYEKILSPQKINELLNADIKTFERIFANAPKSQQNTIADLLVNRVVDNENVDLNVVAYVKKITGKDMDFKIEQMQSAKNLVDGNS